MPKEVTDPFVLAELETSPATRRKAVEDQGVLAELDNQPSRLDKLKTGFTAGAVKMGMGLAGLTPFGPDKERRDAVLREIDKDLDEAGGWGTTGEVGANILGTAV